MIATSGANGGVAGTYPRYPLYIVEVLHRLEIGKDNSNFPSSIHLVPFDHLLNLHIHLKDYK